jgi:hypothetical protein
MSTIFEGGLFFVVVLVLFFSLFYNLNEEAGLAILAKKLFVFTGVQLPSA